MLPIPCRWAYGGSEQMLKMLSITASAHHMDCVCRRSEKQRKKVHSQHGDKDGECHHHWITTAKIWPFRHYNTEQHLFTPPPPSSLKRFVDGLGSNRETWQLLLTPVMSDRLLPRPLHHWQVETRGFILLCSLPTRCKIIVLRLAASRLQGRSKWMLRFGGEKRNAGRPHDSYKTRRGTVFRDMASNEGCRL